MKDSPQRDNLPPSIVVAVLVLAFGIYALAYYGAKSISAADNAILPCEQFEGVKCESRRH